MRRGTERERKARSRGGGVLRGRGDKLTDIIREAEGEAGEGEQPEDEAEGAGHAALGGGGLGLEVEGQGDGDGDHGHVHRQPQVRQEGPLVGAVVPRVAALVRE